MNYLNYFKKSIFFLFLVLFSSIFSFGQPTKSTVPRQDVLLNGLKVLVWSDPTAPKVTIKVRIHSGAAFDPKDKMGVMALLSDILFPTEQAKAFFTEDLEGNLEVFYNYDYIQITASGKSDEVLAMLETISKAVVNPTITPETFKTVQSARVKKIQELEKKSTYLADLAAAKRLLGDFPYGRNIEGTAESLSKIDHADLLFAKQRFLTSDNATIAIIGNVKSDYALRATRQLFGGWMKADKKVPATFAMPRDPDIAPQLINVKDSGSSSMDSYEIRFATRGIARKDNDYFAMRFLVDVLQNRFRAKFPQVLQSHVFVTHERNLLPGVLTFKASINPKEIIEENGFKPLGFSAAFVFDIFKQPISATEFDQTRAKILAEIDQKPMPDKMLDIDTFKLVSVDDEMKKLNAVTLADMQRVSDKISKQPLVNVLLQDSPKE